MRTSFLVRVEKTHGVLLRVISLFHRLALDVDELHFRATDDPKVVSLKITLESDQEVASRIEAHLFKIVEVVSVGVKVEKNRRDGKKGKQELSAGSDG